MAAVVFWGGPLIQLYEFLRSNVCSISIKSLRPATAGEIERMHGDCAICWCEMTVLRATRGSHASSVTGTNSMESAMLQQQPLAAAVDGVSTHAACLPAVGDQAGSVAVTAGSSEPGVGAAEQATPSLAAAGSTCGYSLPCGHAYHYQCLNQVRSRPGLGFSSIWPAQDWYDHLPLQLPFCRSRMRCSGFNCTVKGAVIDRCSMLLFLDAVAAAVSQSRCDPHMPHVPGTTAPGRALACAGATAAGCRQAAAGWSGRGGSRCWCGCCQQLPAVVSTTSG